MGRMDFKKETRIGIVSKLHFECDNCDKTFIICTSESPNGKLNDSVVWASLSIGIGHSQCEELFGVMNIPSMHQKTFANEMVSVKKGIIIGAETKKPLFLGIRNKFCSLCSYYEKHELPQKKHECALNFNGPSTAMEQDIIVEGFSKSIEQHGVIFKYMIGDGDSSVYARIVERVAYGRQVIKIECANHMTRCVSDKLHKISTNTVYPLAARKLLTSKGTEGISRLGRLVKGVRTAVKTNLNQPNSLRQELRNAPYHIFGRHENCSSFCKRKESKEDDLTLQLDQKFFIEIKKIIEPMINMADRLSYNQTTNQAERYMSLVAKCTGGKRVNFTKSSSYTARSYAADLSHTNGPSWHLKALRNGPCGRFTDQIFNRKQKKHELRKSRGYIYKNKKKCNSGTDIYYGPQAALPDISSDNMAERKDKFLNKLAERVSSSQKIENFEISTRGQHDNNLWRELRMDYLTASNFGKVVKRRPTTPCHNLVKQLLYQKKDLKSPAIIYGRINEQKAVSKYEETKNVEVTACGLFVDATFPFLGASPDGLVGDDGIIEVKCLPFIEGKLAESKKSTN
ncbi:unnamed protein product [Phaedon cochleariae]|uniref:YqaJ viral recombinase domain-containing protein n=1 Tax=Phaedon cochleariae TaxID=80249 RepID=A0A9N9X3I1_PHACE|nr:unnamed protein product [Phaedon cochleariae]